MLGNASWFNSVRFRFGCVRSFGISGTQTRRSHPPSEREKLAMELLFTSSLADVLTKIAMFLVVQALVYLILSKSSDVFSKDKKPMSLSFKTPRSLSVRRMLCAISDLPAGEPSPMPERPRTDGDSSSAN